MGRAIRTHRACRPVRLRDKLGFQPFGMTPSPALRRTAQILRLGQRRFDVLVIGGGITGRASPATPRAADSRSPWWNATTSPAAPPAGRRAWCTAASGTSNTVTCGSSSSPATNAGSCCASRPTWCVRCHSPGRCMPARAFRSGSCRPACCSTICWRSSATSRRTIGWTPREWLTPSPCSPVPACAAARGITTPPPTTRD